MTVQSKRSRLPRRDLDEAPEITDEGLRESERLFRELFAGRR